jgi:hypothetical protein
MVCGGVDSGGDGECALVTMMETNSIILTFSKKYSRQRGWKLFFICVRSQQGWRRKARFDQQVSQVISATCVVDPASRKTTAAVVFVFCSSCMYLSSLFVCLVVCFAHIGIEENCL